jgi:hypothetical protein
MAALVTFPSRARRLRAICVLVPGPARTADSIDAGNGQTLFSVMTVMTIPSHDDLFYENGTVRPTLVVLVRSTE